MDSGGLGLPRPAGLVTLLARANRLVALLLLAAAPERSAAFGGDFCAPLPLEGWGVIGRWHVGSAARSAREGWWRPAFRAPDWGKVSAGGWLPEAPAGCWLRARFPLKKPLWQTVFLQGRGWPEGTRAYLNGVEVKWTATSGGAPVDIAGMVHTGDNALVLLVPAVAAKSVKAPEASLVGLSPSGAARSAVLGPPWRAKADKVEAALPPAWLKSADTAPWRVSLPRPLATTDDFLPQAPVCVKAVLDLPPPWEGRHFCLFLHGLAGTPEVWLNGEPISGPIRCPARIDIGRRLRFNGRDTLCLVYPAPPTGPGDDGTWGVAALFWDMSMRPLRIPCGSEVLFDPGEGAGQEGVRRALRYASEVAEVSATPCVFSWGDVGTTPAMTSTGAGGPAGLVVSAWGATTYQRADLDVTRAAVRARVAGFKQQGLRVWVLSPPTIGGRPDTSRNERIRVYNRELRNLVKGEGARLITVFDVFYSCLRRMTTGPRARRWPVRVPLTDDKGTLGPQGAYVLSLAILNELAVP